MDAYRKKLVPAIYTQLGFVRESTPCRFVDCPEDISHLRQYQEIAAGHHCVSKIETEWQLIIKAEFPDDIRARTGTSGDLIIWKYYHWKIWDAESLVTGAKPAEAVDPTNAGIEDHFLESLAHPTSCLPLLRLAEERFDSGDRKGYTLSSEVAFKLKQLEKPLIATIKLRRAKKQLKPWRMPKSIKQTGDPAISTTLRDEILRRDNYRCIFCGQDCSVNPLEVHHIISRSLISKLHLDSALYTAPENLCVTCFECNRGKKDHLAQEDITYYCEAFADAGHPNNGILQHLLTIKRLQTM